jgi:hypothetical protein
MREPQHISETQMRTLLREAYAQDPEKSILGQIARRLRDPAMPDDANDRSRAHPLWLTLGLIVVFVAGVFLYFTLLKPQP